MSAAIQKDITRIYSDGIVRDLSWRYDGDKTLSEATDQWLVNHAITASMGNKLILGDILNYLSDKYGAEDMWNFIDSARIGLHSVKNYRYTSRHTPIENRFSTLSWSHHHAAAPLGAAGEYGIQYELLNAADKKRMGIEAFKEMLKGEPEEDLPEDENYLYHRRLADIVFAIKRLLPDDYGAAVERLLAAADIDDAMYNRMVDEWSGELAKWAKGG